MADLIVRVTCIGGRGEAEGRMFVGGMCRTSDMHRHDPDLGWSTEIEPGSTAAIINTQIIDIAISTVEKAGYSVDPSDQKILLGGAT